MTTRVMTCQRRLSIDAPDSVMISLPENRVTDIEFLFDNNYYLHH
jgi:hypothetical protein